jgi:hypothetical protein
MITQTEKLSLDRPATYQIKVPGELDESWINWSGEITIRIEQSEQGETETTLIGTVDQAGLQGLLRRLYSFGLPLISVKLLDQSDGED